MIFTVLHAIPFFQLPDDDVLATLKYIVQFQHADLSFFFLSRSEVEMTIKPTLY